MADSAKVTNKRTLDAFADDLDAMLNTADTDDNQHVGMIEDDDAIDRLLMGDHFQQVAESEIDEFTDIDELISDDMTGLPSAIAEIDDFADSESEQFVGGIEELNTPGLNALEQVAEVDEFADEDMLAADDLEMPLEKTEAMAEIDEFSDEVPVIKGRNSDLLMNDFDISADDHVVPEIEIENLIDEFDLVEPEFPLAEPPQAASQFEEPAAVAIAATAVVGEVAMISDALARAEATSVAAAPPLPPPVDHSAELADLARQISVLKKQQQAFKLDIAEKAAKEQVQSCLEDLGNLQTEQKKTKRVVESVGSRKPVSAYVASGLAVTAILIGVGLGSQGFIAKSQVTELVGIIGKLQEQVNAAPTNAAADAELLRKEVNELTVANSVTASQIAEINHSLHNDSGSAKAGGGDLSKQLADLNNLTMQMGATIEALEHKISALEKNRIAAVAPVAKPEAKKPVVVEENWVVNLIAYRQDWYAKRKAEEFTAKGIPAKVSQTESKGENWYRLSVDGFKSQYEAAGYAAKVKKTLNLDGVWVAKNKD